MVPPAGGVRAPLGGRESFPELICESLIMLGSIVSPDGEVISMEQAPHFPELNGGEEANG